MFVAAVVSAQPSAVHCGGTSTGAADPLFRAHRGGNYGAAPVADLKSYPIAQANFRFCHGMAFVSDVSAARIADGYLGLVLNGDFTTGRGNFGSAEWLLH